MSKVALVVDNSAAMTSEELKRANVTKLVPISFIVNGEEFYENDTMSHEDFYRYLLDNNTELSTSQPSIELVKDAWREVLKDYDELIYIILSSGLSNACNTAQNASHEDEFEGRVFVANNQRVSYMNKMAMFVARHLINQGKSALEIKEYLEHTAGECGAYIAVDTIKYLKKGGRITPAAAAIATILNIKPILQVHGGKLDSYAKVMAMKVAKSKIIEATRKEAEQRFAEELKDGKLIVSIAHTYPDVNDPELLAFKNVVKQAFPDMKFFVLDPLPAFVACHTGPKAIGVGYAVDRLGVRDEFITED